MVETTAAPIASSGTVDLEGAGATLTAAPASCRWVLRGPADVTRVLAPVCGFRFPTVINTAGSAGERAALMLGPDEWLLLAPPADGPALEAAMSATLAGKPHSLVDVSHRQAALLLEGLLAGEVLNAGVPLDLAFPAFPVGTATRTLFDKAEIVLWRTGADAFRVETGRSLLPYLRTMLADVITQQAAE